ncbi:hypothetical protein ACEWY4_022581 [Coilia grayii]|uniref:Acyl-coenzyme A thioesterase 1-like n=1 Tax=Coilia grayii TaxID=363190 RepID=A0ABD1J6E0_9TELE
MTFLSKGFRVGLSYKDRVAKMSLDSRVALQLSPALSSYFDEPIRVKVIGLRQEQSVVLRSRLTDSRGITFEASATYCSDKNGRIYLDRYPSLGGSYCGIEPMGLFSSLRPLVPHSKLTSSDMTTPLTVDIEVISDGQVLAEETVERRFMANGVQRVSLEGGSIRGSLFLPPGCGPFPALLDMPHLGGALTEIRASLLANKGYVVMALAYHGYQDLPKVLDKLDLEYFEEAVTFLRFHPKVKGPDIGILSISKSGDIALAISAFLPGVAAVVTINGCNANTQFSLRYKDMVIPPTKMDLAKATVRGDGLMDVKDVILDPSIKGNEASVIPIERASCHFLFAASEDDRNWNSVLFSKQAAQRLRDHGKENFEVVRYPEAGHFLDVPFMPHCPTSFHPAVGTVVVLGGEQKAHSEAQVDLWRRIPEFFSRHLNNDNSQFKAMLGPGIGILSISKSGDLALAMSAFLPGVSATVSINGCNCTTVFPLHYKDTVIPPLHVDTSKIIFREDGLLDIRDALLDPTIEENKASVIPIERASCHFLFAASEDDRNWNSVLFSEQAAQQLRDHGKENFEVVRYPKAGHFLDVPFMPHCPTSFHPAVGTVVVLGGEPKAHSEAQVDLWKRIQEFFRRHL